MDIQTLIGHISGYIGLCLGYSLLQIPGFDFMVFRKTSKCLILNKVKEDISTNCIQQTPNEKNGKSDCQDVRIEIENE